MRLENQSNALVLIDSNQELKSNQKSQLSFWGFSKEDDNKYVAVAEDLGSFIEKIYSYLNKSFSNIIFSPECQKIYSEYCDQKNNLAETTLRGSKFKDGIYDEDEFRKFNKFLDRSLARPLRDHQKKSAYHLYLIRNGANFSVPGSGKTSVVLAVYEKLKAEGLVNLLFVIGPPSCFGPWRYEFEQTLGREPDYRILAGGNSGERTNEYYKFGEGLGELYLATFQTLLNDQSHARSFLSNNGVRALLVVDEAHYIKQIDGEWAKAVLSLAPHATYRIILTGTPLPKGFTDVFNMFDFLFPTYPPINDQAKLQIEHFEKQKMLSDAKSVLDSRIGPLFYRVRKIDLGLLPAVFHEPILVKMNHYESLLYDGIVKKIQNYAKEDYLKNIDLVQRLLRGRVIRLRQCTSYAKLMTTAIDNYDENLLVDEKDLETVIANYDKLEKPAKLMKLIDMVQGLQKSNQKVVIWSNFRETLRLLKRELAEHGFRSEMIYGDTPTQVTAFSDEKTREQIRDEFVDKESGLDILIANPAACAESISLHKTCFHAIYYDLSYNCAQYLQSLDRIHRVGGSENNQAHYYFLQYESSIDQDILSNVRRKAQQMNDIIEKDYEVYSLDMFEEDGEAEAYKRLFGGGGR
jgi:SNF2 family DNA or RNA helicase